MSWYIWIGIAVIFGVIEAFSLGLTTIWFAGGALVTAVCSYFGMTLLSQIFIFLIISIILLAFTRPIIKQKMKIGKEKTNMEALPGKTAVVTEEISEGKTGRVKLNGMEWMAEGCDENLDLKKGECVIVCGVRGVRLIVDEKKSENVQY